MNFKLKPCDADHGRTAPFAFRYSVDLDAPADRVFQTLASDVWTDFFPDIRSVKWLSGTGGVGSVREVTTDALTVRERFIVWEAGKRMMFYAEGMSLPLVTEFTEDFELTPLGDARCRLRWDVGYRPRTVFRPIHPVLRVIFDRMFRRGVDGIQKYAREKLR